MDDAANGFRAIESRGAVPLARVWSHKSEDIARVLDAGALGVVIPHVSNRAQAEALVQAVRYPPLGQRSAGTGRNQTFVDYPAVANEQILLIPQIEDLEGVDQIGEIMAVPGIDVGFIGPHDLGLSMGLKADQIGTDPEHERQLMRILEGCQAAGKPAGLPVAQRGRRQQVDLTGIPDDRPHQRPGPVAERRALRAGTGEGDRTEPASPAHGPPKAVSLPPLRGSRRDGAVCRRSGGGPNAAPRK